MKRGLIVILAVLILFSSFVSAAAEEKNVAYVYNSRWSIDSRITGIFSELGFTTEFIKCSALEDFDLLEYDFVFVGDEWLNCADEINVNEHPSLVMNGRHARQFGLADRKGISITASNSPLNVNADGIISQVYTRAKYSRKSLIMYYLSGLLGFNAAEIHGGSGVSYIDKGTLLKNGNIANENICFFGITKTAYWTDDTRDLFEDCINFVAGEEENPPTPPAPVCGDGVKEGTEECDDGNIIDGDGCSALCITELPPASVCGNGLVEGTEECDDGNIIDGDGCSATCTIEQIPPEPTLVHDVGLSDLKIEYSNGSLVLGDTPQLIKDNDYKILIDLTNLGNFTENVTFEGKIKSGEEVVKTFTHVAVNNFEPGDKKDDKTRTVTFNINQSFYQVTVQAITDIDDVPANNIVSMNIEVI